MVRRWRRSGEDPSSKIPMPIPMLSTSMSSRMRPEELVPLLRTESLGDFRCEDEEDE